MQLNLATTTPALDAIKAEIQPLNAHQRASILGTIKFATTAHDTGRKSACLYWLDIAEETAEACGVHTAVRAIRAARELAKAEG